MREKILGLDCVLSDGSCCEKRHYNLVSRLRFYFTLMTGSNGILGTLESIHIPYESNTVLCAGLCLVFR